ncbi:MAG: hypothetical protein IPN22_11160 [Bacteroidetes bacterium]|nr:hypothetical protein [Bacteroidota bacterium]
MIEVFTKRSYKLLFILPSKCATRTLGRAGFFYAFEEYGIYALVGEATNGKGDTQKTSGIEKSRFALVGRYKLFTS